MEQRYLAARGQTLNGRKVWGPNGGNPGEPVPAACITRTVISIGWIQPCSEEEWKAACAFHGTPPEKISVGWDYGKKSTPPKTTTKKAATTTAAKTTTKKTTAKKAAKKKTSKRKTSKRKKAKRA